MAKKVTAAKATAPESPYFRESLLDHLKTIQSSLTTTQPEIRDLRLLVEK